jgi:hypothetical protein
MSHPQKGKNRKRPRAWHRGRRAGALQARALEPLQQAASRQAETDRQLDEIRARGHEETALWRALEHLAPHAPAPWGWP